MRRGILAIVVAFAFGLSGQAFGQTLPPKRTTRISGRLKNFDGVPVSNATVRLIHTESDETAGETKTGPDGRFSFLGVVPCFYDLYFVAAGAFETDVFTLPGKETNVPDVFLAEPKTVLGHRRSRLIESFILGFPVPQLVLAENPRQRGTFIVIDGKQRLLTNRSRGGCSSSRYFHDPCVSS